MLNPMQFAAVQQTMSDDDSDQREALRGALKQGLVINGINAVFGGQGANQRLALSQSLQANAMARVRGVPIV